MREMSKTDYIMLVVKKHKLILQNALQTKNTKPLPNKSYTTQKTKRDVPS